jgi:hypothetical protein
MITNDIKICIDLLNDHTIAGWFINIPTLEEDQISLHIDGQYQAITQANFIREDVEKAHGQLHCGFSFDLTRFFPYQDLVLKSANKKVIYSYTHSIKSSKTSLALSAPYSQQRHYLLQSIKIDLSKPINGHNWYDIEPTGRWGGPELESTLIIPALVAGNYQLDLKIDNHFCDFKAMTVKLNDKLIHFSNTDFPPSVILQAEVSIEKTLSFWQLVFNYSEIHSTDNSQIEQRKLALFLETVTLSKRTSTN